MEDSIERKQIRLLVETIRKVATSKRTPDWIKRDLENGVREAKSLKSKIDPTVTEECQDNLYPLEVGCIAVNKIDKKDKCKYQILSKGMLIDGVQLWDVLIIEGDGKNPVGVTIPNVQEFKLSAIKPAPKSDSNVPSSSQEHQSI